MRSSLSRKVASALAIVAAASFAGPAPAAVIIELGQGSFDADNVLFQTAQSGTTLTGTTNQSGVDVTFMNDAGILTEASGQASLTGTNADGVLLGTTTFVIAAGQIFTAAEFNLPGIPGNPPPAEALSVFIEALNASGDVIGSQTLDLSGNGQNFINVLGTEGDAFSGIRLILGPEGAGVGSLQQVRLGGIATVVPEPGTWGLMLLGFAAAGYALRRGARRRSHLLQIA